MRSHYEALLPETNSVPRWHQQMGTPALLDRAEHFATYQSAYTKSIDASPGRNRRVRGHHLTRMS
jgi:hypothetical protein